LCHKQISWGVVSLITCDSLHFYLPRDNGCNLMFFVVCYNSSARVSNQIDWIKTNVCKNSAYPPSDLCGASGTGSPTKKPTPVSN
jgi:hypothetical protein